MIPQALPVEYLQLFPHGKTGRRLAAALDNEYVPNGCVVYNYNENGYRVMIIGFDKSKVQTILDEYLSVYDFPGQFTGRDARSTALEMAKEHGIPAAMVEHDTDIDIDD